MDLSLLTYNGWSAIKSKQTKNNIQTKHFLQAPLNSNHFKEIYSNIDMTPAGSATQVKSMKVYSKLLKSPDIESFVVLQMSL